MYIALKHQVNDKMQYRNKGKYDIINRQPVTGKKNTGGLRFGQMEREILIAIDAMNTLKELWKCDIISINICPLTGKIETDCCKNKIKSHKFFVLCLGYIRGLGYDILLHNDKTYSIVKLDKE